MKFNAHLVATSIVLVVAIWLSSGTMAPYAATAQYPAILEPCHYLISVDHDQFAKMDRMISGDDASTWGGSVVLRRMLFPIIAFPFVRAAGFMAGGLLASIVVNVLALIAFSFFVRRRIGERGAILVAWLLSTYPGTTYWAGLPYAYAAIVPGSLICAMLLYRLHEAATLRETLRTSLYLGVLFTAYDFLPFFGTAALVILFARKRFRWTVPAGIVMLMPNAAIILMFVLISIQVVNNNTAGYINVLSAYLHPLRDVPGTLQTLMHLPAVFVATFFFSNLVFLPLLFITAMARAWRQAGRFLEKPDRALLVASFVLFLFLNAAPPYYGWQFRGEWIARLFQPVFPAFLLAIARFIQQLEGASLKRWSAAVFATIALNASVAFGPVLMNPLAGWVYYKFYAHSPPNSLITNLERFGRRPLGVCSDSHQWDHMADPHTEFNRPSYMYRYRTIKRRNNR
jgi:hypothetical protein